MSDILEYDGDGIDHAKCDAIIARIKMAQAIRAREREEAAANITENDNEASAD